MTMEHKAAQDKDDGFQLRARDIQDEIGFYAHELQGKRVMCAFDAPSSPFMSVLGDNFESLGLKELNSCGYAETHGMPCLMLARREGTYTRKQPDIQAESIKKGFWSDAAQKMLDESDIVITKPPFSRYQEVLELLLNKKKKFLIAGTTAMLGRGLVARSVGMNLMWTGATQFGQFIRPDGAVKPIGNGCWFTNMLPAAAPGLVLEYQYDPRYYPRYSNFAAIDVAKPKYIPTDYFGIMGVPEAFLRVYGGSRLVDDGRIDRLFGPMSRWFDIIGRAPDCLDAVAVYGAKFCKDYAAGGGKARLSAKQRGLALYDINGRAVLPYRRILIKRKSGGPQMSRDGI